MTWYWQVANDILDIATAVIREYKGRFSIKGV